MKCAVAIVLALIGLVVANPVPPQGLGIGSPVYFRSSIVNHGITVPARPIIAAPVVASLAPVSLGWGSYGDYSLSGYDHSGLGGYGIGGLAGYGLGYKG